VERAEDVRAALERGVATTRQGQPVVLEMVTKEEPVYPVAAQLLRELASSEAAVRA
jgi:hypothetical protein